MNAVGAILPTVTVRREPLGSRLIAVVEDYYDLPDGAVCNPARRNGNVSKARWAIAHVLIEEAGWNGPRIGRLLSKDHKAIAYGYKQSPTLLRNDPLFFEAVRLLKEEMSPHERDNQI